MHQYSTAPRAKIYPKQPRALPSSTTLLSLVKAALVKALGFILAWKPTLTMLLGRIIWRLLPWLKEA